MPTHIGIYARIFVFLISFLTSSSNALGPLAAGPIEATLDHVLESGLLEPALILGWAAPVAVHLARRFYYQLVPLVQLAVDRGFASVPHREPPVLILEVSTWRKCVEGLLDDKGRIIEARDQSAPVDIVELGGEGPLVFGIVDLECAV